MYFCTTLTFGLIPPERQKEETAREAVGFILFLYLFSLSADTSIQSSDHIEDRPWQQPAAFAHHACKSFS